ncbi:serine/threonine-protein kinase [Paenibacillus sp. FSL F4-0236]|uniref:serine/threonine-protein kinase n=1 Tax=Paenibacillus sp. FSL F4-0236 TaxID=2954731 RepID=UPI0030F89FCB
MEENDIYKNRFQIIRSLGKGGVGEVFLALDTFTQRKIALKVYSNRDNVSTARIQREVEIISKLKHTNIPVLFDVGFFKNTYYLVQEFIDGNTLENEINTTSVTIREAISYSKDILSALSYLHQNNIIHRDLKPSNIIISRTTKKAVLFDFGISKTDSNWTDNLTLTQPGGFIGTPAFMAPEQIENQSVTFKADIYSLGLILYKLFSGKLPFDYKNIKDIFSRATKSYQVIIKNDTLIGSEKLEELINQMLSLDPDNRPEMNEVLQIINILETSNSDRIQDKLLDDFKPTTEDVEAFELKVDEKQHKSGTGFFSNEQLRQEEISASREFYRNHLDLDYKTLLSQAKISFWLWFATLVIGFLIILTAIILLFMDKPLQSGGMALSEVFIYIVQNIFKIREDHYREQANNKTKHLEIGNYWNLITQSIDAIEENAIKSSKLNELVDNLNSHIKNQ